MLLGIGFGGFVDGIVLHQILQWHHMLTDTGDHPATTVAGLEANTLADGLFHVATWVVAFAGANLTIRAWQRRRRAPPWRVQVGLLLAGWGGFNLVEGIINHHLLAIHHVRDDAGGPVSWDLGFLLLGAVLVGVGVALARTSKAASGVSQAARPQTSNPADQEQLTDR
ncbi:DUF2243 domain-containing protein [Iamia sp.]|uniref:DUF2243 domain-containing protein n=1 Tax=Iamia sp. TaxID=2722710 RepID=UPI002BE3A233|nr:DUF2243 domain-containing protein [Iamia sp.]HXH57309.1 DUF2243 domain-containing protein [Iamia sp.]